MKQTHTYKLKKEKSKIYKPDQEKTNPAKQPKKPHMTIKKPYRLLFGGKSVNNCCIVTRSLK